MAEKKQRRDLDLPIYLFHQGTNYRSYAFLGSHPARKGRASGAVFRVWAPHAAAVSVVGDFNGWDHLADPMEEISANGVWEGFVPGVKRFDRYKYAVTAADGRVLLKADPYAYHNETRPASASMFYDLDNYLWQDADWMKNRPEHLRGLPVNIYELHLGSWKRYPDGSFFSYRKIADELAAYAVEMGYTHVEVLPLTEHPYDGSWGYQSLGYFAPTSRYGTPEDLMYFVDTLHQAGVGVIFDWVPAHFPKDAYGLAEFDGECCYEYRSPLMGEQGGWGTKVFDFGRNEVRCFLISSANFWCDKFHADGIRADAVSSMLYRDYGREGAEWERNVRGGRENFEAISLLRDLNTSVLTGFPGVSTIAEESTAWPLVTKPPYAGGLGFSFKWNMGWMNDMLEYASLDPIYRAYNHDKVTFGLMYAFSENFILPVSHDEVVHGKRSLINKMPGGYGEKFAGTRAFLGFMTAYPGKKLLFMGQEFGQFIEWDEKRELDWLLLDFEAHRRLRDYTKTLNHLYLETPALWERDDSWEGFRWAVCDDNASSVVAFLRMDGRGGELLCAVNFCPVERPYYRVPVRGPSVWEEVLSSDAAEFGGAGIQNGTVKAEPAGDGFALALRLPPLSAVYLRKLPEGEPRE